MKLRTCAMARRWMFATALVTASMMVPAHGLLAQGGDTTTTPTSAASPLICDGTITTAPDAAGTQREVCVTPQPATAGASGSSSDHDTTYGILIGATLVIAGSATSLYAHRRRLVLGKPFRRRSA